MNTPVEAALLAQGVFKGAHGLQGFANAREFWDRQAYGTRLYYGDGITDYLHHGVLTAAIKALEESAAMKLALDLIAAGVAEIVDYGGGSIRFFVGKDSMIKRPADTWTATIEAIGWTRAREALAERGGL